MLKNNQILRYKNAIWGSCNRGNIRNLEDNIDKRGGWIFDCHIDTGYSNKFYMPSYNFVGEPEVKQLFERRIE